MNFLISIIKPASAENLSDICRELDLPVTLTLRGRGTATKSMRDLLGIETLDKRIIFNVADDKKTGSLIKAQRRRLYIDAPGNGVVISVPIKSVGGGRTLSYLNQNAPEKKKTPELNYEYELILAIINEGFTDAVMDEARAAGATGGTVIHAKGTGAKNAEKFFSVSIAQEKELLLIVARASQKTEIMSAILKQSGPDSKAGAILFSLPVNEIGGFKLADLEQPEEE